MEGIKFTQKYFVKIIYNLLNSLQNQIKENSKAAKEIKDGLLVASEQLLSFGKEKKHKILYKNPENIKLVLDAVFTNEVRGTSYSSRIDDPKYQFAGKTGTAQVKRITAKARELALSYASYSI